MGPRPETAMKLTEVHKRIAQGEKLADAMRSAGLAASQWYKHKDFVPTKTGKPYTKRTLTTPIDIPVAQSSKVMIAIGTTEDVSKLMREFMQ